MSWAYDHLGLRPDADERDVKRAYARQLKETRPSEDPEGFQRLREAYEAALAQAARRARAADEEAADDPAADEESGNPTDPGAVALEPARVDAPPEPVPKPPAGWQAAAAASAPVQQVEPEPEPVGTRVTLTPVDIARRVLVQAAVCQTPEAVQQWLVEQPFLWQLDLKHAVADALPWVLNECEEPLFADSLDALWAFFDLDQVTDGSHVDRTYAYQQKRHELSLRWLMVNDNREQVIRPDQQQRLQAVWAPGFMGISYASAKLARHLAWASRPATPWQNVLRALRWGQTDHMARLMAWLSNEWQYALVPPLDRGQLRFWLRAHDHTAFSRERLAVVLAQYAAAMLVLLTPLMGLQVMVDGWASFDWRLVAYVAAWGLVVPLYRGLWSPLAHWQAMPEAAVERHAWWHTLCVPLFALAGALLLLLNAGPVAAVVWGWGFWLMRYRLHGRKNLNWGGDFGGSALWGLSILVLLTVGYWGAFALLVLWAWELYKARPLALARASESP